MVRIQSFTAGKHHVLRNGEHLVSAVFRAPQTAGRNFEVRTGSAGGEMRELRNVPFTVPFGFHARHDTQMPPVCPLDGAPPTHGSRPRAI